MKINLEKFTPLLQQVFKYKFAGISLLALVVLSVTITQAQKVSGDMVDTALIDQKLLELQKNAVEIDQQTIEIINDRFKNSTEAPKPVNSSTTNPFTFN